MGVKVKGQGHVTPRFDRVDARSLYLVSIRSATKEGTNLAAYPYLLAQCQFVYFIPDSLYPYFPAFPVLADCQLLLASCQF